MKFEKPRITLGDYWAVLDELKKFLSPDYNRAPLENNSSNITIWKEKSTIPAKNLRLSIILLIIGFMNEQCLDLRYLPS